MSYVRAFCIHNDDAYRVNVCGTSFGSTTSICRCLAQLYLTRPSNLEDVNSWQHVVQKSLRGINMNWVIC
jgi:hypothetical protein